MIVVNATVALKLCRTTIRCTNDCAANGPLSCTAANVATTETNSVAGAAPRCSKRQAIQPRTGSTKNINCEALEKAATHVATSKTARIAASGYDERVTERGCWTAKS